MKRMNKKVVFLSLKFAITTILFVWLIQKTNLSKILPIIGKARFFPLFIGFLCFSSTNIIAAKKWSFILRGFNIRLPLTKLISLYWTGAFFNNFLPSIIGGDGIKVYKIIKKTKKNDNLNASLSILIDRIFGFGALLTLGLFFTLYKFYEIPRAMSIFIFSINICFVLIYL